MCISKTLTKFMLHQGPFGWAIDDRVTRPMGFKAKVDLSPAH